MPDHAALDAILQRVTPQSSGLWREIVPLLDAWPDDATLPGAIAQVDAATASWFAAWRPVPEIWWRPVIKRKGAPLSARKRKRGEAFHPAMAATRSLELVDKRITDKALRLLAACPALVHMRKVTHGSGRFTDAGMIEFIRSPFLRPTEALTIAQRGITAESIAALAEAPWLSRLEHLHITEAEIGAAGARLIAESGRLQSMQRLIIGWGARLGDAGVIALCGADAPRLWELGVGRNEIGDAGALALLRSGVASINLHTNSVTDAAIDAWLEDPDAARHVRSLTLGGNQISAAAVARITDAFQKAHGDHLWWHPSSPHGWTVYTHPVTVPD